MPRGQWEAIEADLVPMGYSLGDIPYRLGWRQFRAWLIRAPRESNVYRHHYGVPSKWGDDQYMMALLVDYLALLLWINTEDGRRRRNRPKPLPRPGIEEQNTTRFGNEAMTMAQARKRLGW